MDLERLASLRTRYDHLVREMEALGADSRPPSFEYARLRLQKKKLGLLIAQLEDVLLPDGVA